MHHSATYCCSTLYTHKCFIFGVQYCSGVYPSPSANQYALFHKFEYTSQPTAYLKICKSLLSLAVSSSIQEGRCITKALRAQGTEMFLTRWPQLVLLLNLQVFPNNISLGKLILSSILLRRIYILSLISKHEFTSLNYVIGVERERQEVQRRWSGVKNTSSIFSANIYAYLFKCWQISCFLSTFTFLSLDSFLSYSQHL